jgi:hypothetical protein
VTSIWFRIFLILTFDDIDLFYSCPSIKRDESS